MGKHADWVHYSGVVAGRHVGMTLMHQSDNPPSPYFVPDYGTMCNNFTLDQPYDIKAGEALQLRFRLLAHTGGPDDVDIAGHHAAFVT